MRRINIFNGLITVITVITGILFFYNLILLYISGSVIKLAASVIIPFVGYIICTVLRSKINAKRPYEISGEENLLGKKTTGKSFPSRHVFSIFIIGTTVLFSNIYMGAVLLLLGVCLAVLRVYAKVHFIRDVVAGALLGIILGCGIYFIGG